MAFYRRRTTLEARKKNFIYNEYQKKFRLRSACRREQKKFIRNFRPPHSAPVYDFKCQLNAACARSREITFFSPRKKRSVSEIKIF